MACKEGLDSGLDGFAAGLEELPDSAFSLFIYERPHSPPLPGHVAH
ncbi:MAG: hypothetical protein IMY86_02930 [Chloroflexi bacterium]|nr:hypothetical protein [Chloroflexota bacterium]